MDEIHLTVDTQILVIAHKADHTQRLPCHSQLQREIETRVYLALDGENQETKGQVLVEYEKQMPTGSSGRIWLARLAKNNRLRFYKKLSPLPRPLLIKREKVGGLSRDDQKWVRLALATQTKRLISEDQHFGDKVCGVLKNKPACVLVHTTQDICDWISANLGDPHSV